jgi:hypothetical protein
MRKVKAFENVLCILSKPIKIIKIQGKTLDLIIEQFPLSTSFRCRNWHQCTNVLVAGLHRASPSASLDKHIKFYDDMIILSLFAIVNR